MNHLRTQSVKAIAGYLKRRIKQITGRAPTEISGAIALLKNDGWEEKLEGQIEILIDAILKQVLKNKNVRILKLTNLSKKIGQRILNDYYPDNIYLYVGDLFLEALFTLDYIDIKKPGGPFSNASIEVHLKSNIETILPELYSVLPQSLQCTTETKPFLTEDMWRTIGNYKGPVIKNTNKRDSSINTHDIWITALDKMQRTPWKLNKRVFDAIVENSHLFIADNKNLSEREKGKAFAFNYIIKKASLTYNMNKFYQGLDCDYRGRYYTIESGFEYQGEDISRGMMMFYEGKPLGSNGNFWLAIHTATSFNKSYHINEIPEWAGRDEDGNLVIDYKTHLKTEQLESISVDKMALEDQAKWTFNNIEQIIKLGMEGSFWTEEDRDYNEKFLAEKPVTFLACCVEWYNYSIEGDDYVSHLPIPIDAHSSGWQHLSSCTLDEQTGKYVGLIPSEIPVDFYVSVAKGVIARAKQNAPKIYDFLSKLPMKMIRKCITKRSSMVLALT